MLLSLTDTMLADRITQIVRSTGLDPRHMMLEITETAAMTEVAPALENLARLRMRGFGLSVDDYGTGFSSLRQLTRVPFTELKIDQGFVTGCAATPSSRHCRVERGNGAPPEHQERRRGRGNAGRLGCAQGRGL